MADVEKMSSGAATRDVTGRWRWFIALGVCELILGGIASTDLMVASLASVLVIGVTMVFAGLVQIVHAFSSRGGGGILFWLLAGVAYCAVGGIVLLDPVLASLTLSLTAGLMLIAAGAMRMWAGIGMRPSEGWQWIVTAGAFTVCVGGVMVTTWPAIGLWFLGGLLVVDLIFRGWGLIAFGVSLRRARPGRRPKPL